MTREKLFLFIFSFISTALFPVSAYGDSIHQSTNGTGSCSIIVNGDGVKVENVCNENYSNTSTLERNTDIENVSPANASNLNSRGYKPEQSPPLEITSSPGYTPEQSSPLEIIGSPGYAPEQSSPLEIIGSPD